LALVGQGRGGRHGDAGGGRSADPHPLEPEDPAFQSPLAVPPALSVLLALAGVVGVVTLLAGLLVAAGSLVVRYRRARGLERQQLRWLALAAALSAWRCWRRWPWPCWTPPWAWS
jgi:hypothetical protein